MKCFLRLFVSSFIFVLGSLAQADLSRIYFNDQNLFLNGLNLAWRNFANDIGPNTSTPDLNHFADVFSQMESNGGNVMRLWLHTNGANTPAWSGSTVTGPGTDTIADLEAILDLAWQHEVGMMLCLWSFDMQRISYGSTITDRAYDILTNATYRQLYIDNSLIPMVTALEGHPAIVAWEIFNEPEGMSDLTSWSGIYHDVTMADIQAFVNVCAGAIHRADPTIMVTNGCWDIQASSDVDGHYNYYTDARLLAQGGDSDGYLDFYCVHYYDWAGTAHSPFLHDASYWGLDKPLVTAEFYPDCDNCTAAPYEALYQNGYAGALGWSWTDIDPALMLTQMEDMYNNHQADVDIILGNEPTVSITWPVDNIKIRENVDLTIYADANDLDGTITKVEFFEGTNKLGEDTTSPYELTWNNINAGAYGLTAKATDNDDLAATSTAINIIAGSVVPQQTRFEAEDGVLIGSTVSTSEPGYSGSGYVTGFDNSGDKVTVTVNVGSAGSYPLLIGYRITSGWGDKINDILVNDILVDSPNFTNTNGAWSVYDFGDVTLNAGDNTITFERNWGYMDVDYFELALPVLCQDGDLNMDCVVDINDLIILARGWLNPYNYDDFSDIYIGWFN
jgi:Carbohydrate binding module (family 35)/Bacterial Ig domain/Cellulase (glycosyl hydrolase family 5)